MPQFTCEKCTTTFDSPPGVEGPGEMCPSCGAPFAVAQEAREPAAATFDEENLAVAQKKRKSGKSNIITGIVLIVMGLSGWFGGSIFTGDADIIDTGFDLLGVGLVIWGSVQCATSSS